MKFFVFVYPTNVDQINMLKYSKCSQKNSMHFRTHKAVPRQISYSLDLVYIFKKIKKLIQLCVGCVLIVYIFPSLCFLFHIDFLMSFIVIIFLFYVF